MNRKRFIIPRKMRAHSNTKKIAYIFLCCAFLSPIPVKLQSNLCIRRPLEKFVDSPYYSESELCGGAVTVSFSKYLSWQAMHFLQRSTQFSKTFYRPLIASKFLASELPFHGWKSPEIAWVEIWTVWRMF
jgi:hypothetical protein